MAADALAAAEDEESECARMRGAFGGLAGVRRRVAGGDGARSTLAGVRRRVAGGDGARSTLTRARLEGRGEPEPSEGLGVELT